MVLALKVATGCSLLIFLLVVFRRGKAPYCYSLIPYLLAQLAVNVSATAWPALSLNWDVWLAKEILYSLLRLSILAELGLLIFRTLPRARTRVHILLSLTALFLAVTLPLPYDSVTPYPIARDIISRFHYVTAWGLIALLGLAVWYHLPLHAFHKALLHGQLWLMLVHIGILFAAPRIGTLVASHIYHVVQLVILAVWIRVAWLRDPKWDTDELAVIRYLQPWRTK
jgi:hypothetical protein